MKVKNDLMAEKWQSHLKSVQLNSFQSDSNGLLRAIDQL